MTERPADYGREVRDTIVKSTLTGVAATVLAVTIFSPSVLGGMIGTSLASGTGVNVNDSEADNPYVNLPPYPAPLTGAELAEVHNQLARSIASLEISRAATDAKIEHIRSIAVTDDMVSFSPTRTADAAEGLRLRTSESDTFAAAAPESTFGVAPAPVIAAAEADETTLTPASYQGGVDPSFRDPHLELADLLLAHETF